MVKNKIQFFDLNSRKLKEIININRYIYYYPQDLLCMINDKCLCVGGEDKKIYLMFFKKILLEKLKIIVVIYVYLN